MMNIQTWLLRRFTKEEARTGLWPLEWTMMVYMMFTFVLMAFLWNELVDVKSMLLNRLFFVLILGAVWMVYHFRPCRLTAYLRVVLVMFTLGSWYPDTYEFNRLFLNLDHVFSTFEHNIFGCQPSLVFGEKFPQWWVSEPLYLGYFSYFPMMIVLVTTVWLKCIEHLQRVTFIMMASFFLYYVVYIFLPVAGPQYYFLAPGVDAAAGIFPNVGYYFHEMRSMYPAAGSDGLFHDLVNMAHNAGERPTAAFPSSHVGVATIILLLCRRCGLTKLMLVLLPFYILMCLATVYIHAHYVIDAIAGFITAFALYSLLDRCFTLMEKRRDKWGHP